MRLKNIVCNKKYIQWYDYKTELKVGKGGSFFDRNEINYNKISGCFTATRLNLFISMVCGFRIGLYSSIFSSEKLLRK